MEKTVLIEKKNMKPRLYYAENGYIQSLDINGQISIGRKPNASGDSIAFPYPYVSRQHGYIDIDESGVYYLDNNSTNGTFINAKRATSGQKHYLYDGCVVQVKNALASDENSFVTIVFSTDYSNDCENACIDLTADIGEVNIGRSSGSDVRVGDKAASALHASFFAARQGFAVIDRGSTNGVFVNGKKLTAPQYISIGDCIRVANTYFFYTGKGLLYLKGANAEKQSGASLQIHIEERSVWQRAKKLMLLQNIDITVNAGEMVLILGGSGAGKTTFMNAVMGYEKAVGSIIHGDMDLYEDFDTMKYKIGFVPQQDLLRGNDTVFDTLENAAQMKLPSSVKRKERESRIENVLNTLGLSRERYSLVSKLSGGQRKRLSIAVEYISDPSLFFLDEPDSGLDGVMSRALMENLRSIANEGKIVMVISHGPDRAADLFDKVIVLAKSTRDNCGHLAFYGSVNQAYAFFGTSSLEGVVKRINREDEGGDGLSDYYIDKYASII